MEYPARAGAGLPGLAGPVAACRGRHADGRSAPGADRGRGSAGLGAAPHPGRPHRTACARRAPVPPVRPAAVLQPARPGRVHVGRGSRRHAGRLPARPPQQRPEIHRRSAAGHQRARTGWRLRKPEDAGKCRDPGPASPPPALPATAARALQLVARWAAAEQGASTVGDLLTLAPGITELPPDVAHSWDHLGQLDLHSLTGTVPAGHGLALLAGRLLGEVADDRRRLIVTSRTFAPQRRTYDSLAAELGVSRGRVRQLETSALQQLAHAAMEDQYAPLRWRAASAARPGAAPAAEVPGAPLWMRQLLSWLAEKTA